MNSRGLHSLKARRSYKEEAIRNYSASGVDISEGEKFVEKLKPLVKTTFSDNVLSGVGNFGAFFRIPTGYKSPVFVSSADGVGTKLKIAVAMKRFDTIGEDLVNHCVNDIAVCGAKPLFFLDYLAFGKLKSNVALEIVKGMVRACKQNSCSLIGGETAEMPDLYAKNEFDIAGTIIGIAEKNRLLIKKDVRAGDVIIGIASNGLHTNGYSLARNVLVERFDLNDYIEEINSSLGNELLRIHRSYLRLIQRLTEKFKISSFAHVTGGGIEGNTKRVIPEKLKAKFRWGSWNTPPVFKLIQRTGNILESEMRKVFNLGIGLVCISRAKDTESIIKFLRREKERFYIIGEVVGR